MAAAVVYTNDSMRARSAAAIVRRSRIKASARNMLFAGPEGGDKQGLGGGEEAFILVLSRLEVRSVEGTEELRDAPVAASIIYRNDSRRHRRTSGHLGGPPSGGRVL